MEIVFIWLLLAAGVGALASSRGRSGFGFFLLSAVFSPLLGLIVVLVARDLKEEEQQVAVRQREHELDLERVKAIARSAASAQPGPAILPARAEPTISIADELTKLAALKDKGILTEAEFDGQKAALLRRRQPSAWPFPSDGESSQPVTPQPTAGATYGTCPNCGSAVHLDSESCHKCGAQFGVGSDWRVKRPGEA